ncbi:hypothetical protein Cni_G04420 [Canna indica]|uniref:Uncharacterized protein n=1 Tax=Canna indica TaxID=4628 RepID=A0AAQ3JUN3_9LILI|nr:hypothetical protein Cni_G04420 [Canna indica]
MEEFQEAEILWPAADHSQEEESLDVAGELRQHRSPCRARRKASSSNPISIPSRAQSSHVKKYENKDSVTDQGIIPPHVVAADEKMMNVKMGEEYVLKGRELVRLRNYVLRMTGFLER